MSSIKKTAPTSSLEQGEGLLIIAKATTPGAAGVEFQAGLKQCSLDCCALGKQVYAMQDLEHISGRPECHCVAISIIMKASG